MRDKIMKYDLTVECDECGEQLMKIEKARKEIEGIINKCECGEKFETIKNKVYKKKRREFSENVMVEGKNVWEKPEGQSEKSFDEIDEKDLVLKEEIELAEEDFTKQLSSKETLIYRKTQEVKRYSD